MASYVFPRMWLASRLDFMTGRLHSYDNEKFNMKPTPESILGKRAASDEDCYPSKRAKRCDETCNITAHRITRSANLGDEVALRIRATKSQTLAVAAFERSNIEAETAERHATEEALVVTTVNLYATTESLHASEEALLSTTTKLDAAEKAVIATTTKLETTTLEYESEIQQLKQQILLYEQAEIDNKKALAQELKLSAELRQVVASQSAAMNEAEITFSNQTAALNEAEIKLSNQTAAMNEAEIQFSNQTALVEKVQSQLQRANGMGLQVEQRLNESRAEVGELQRMLNDEQAEYLEQMAAYNGVLDERCDLKYEVKRLEALVAELGGDATTGGTEDMELSESGSVNMESEEAPETPTSKDEQIRLLTAKLAEVTEQRDECQLSVDDYRFQTDEIERRDRDLEAAAERARASLRQYQALSERMSGTDMIIRRQSRRIEQLEKENRAQQKAMGEGSRLALSALTRTRRDLTIKWSTKTLSGRHDGSTPARQEPAKPAVMSSGSRVGKAKPKGSATGQKRMAMRASSTRLLDTALQQAADAESSESEDDDDDDDDDDMEDPAAIQQMSDAEDAQPKDVEPEDVQPEDVVNLEELATFANGHRAQPAEGWVMNYQEALTWTKDGLSRVPHCTLICNDNRNHAVYFAANESGEVELLFIDGKRFVAGGPDALLAFAAGNKQDFMIKTVLSHHPQLQLEAAELSLGDQGMSLLKQQMVASYTSYFYGATVEETGAAFDSMMRGAIDKTMYPRQWAELVQYLAGQERFERAARYYIAGHKTERL
ncbi:hypothetical protein LTR28_012086, partial [Elasticomyces elasticus]